MTTRRAFLASLVAAIAGRSLFRKPKETGIPIRMIRHWDSDLRGWRVRMDVIEGYGSLFNPRENLAAQYKGLQFHRDAFTLVASEFDRGFATIPVPLLPSPIAFNPHFGVDFEWDVKELAA